MKFELGNTHLKPVNLKFWRRNGWWRDASANHHAPRRNADWAKESGAQEVTLFLRPQPSNFLAIKEELRLFCAESVISERFFAAQDWLCKVDSVTCCSPINLVLLLQWRLSWFLTAISSKGMLNLSSRSPKDENYSTLPLSKLDRRKSNNELWFETALLAFV